MEKQSLYALNMKFFKALTHATTTVEIDKTKTRKEKVKTSKRNNMMSIIQHKANNMHKFGRNI